MTTAGGKKVDELGNFCVQVVEEVIAMSNAKKNSR
jgi:hypothetical protein